MNLTNLVSSGIKSRNVKTALYGVEGVGKTSFASKFPKPLILDLDRGSNLIDVNRITSIDTWENLLEVVRSFRDMKDNPFLTLVIDTVDIAAALCERYLIRKKFPNNPDASLEDFGYGKGYKMLAEQFSILLVNLESVVDAGYNVVLIAHAKMRVITRPEDNTSYDHWELKLPGNSTNQLSPLIKEFADLLLFADFKTRVVVVDGKKKARDAGRVMYTTHTPFADAKNRFGLDDILPFTYESIASIIPDKRIKLIDPTADAFIDVDAKIKADKEKQEKQEKKKTTKNTTNKRQTKKVESETMKELKKLMKADDIEDFRLMDALAIAGAYPKGTKLEDLPDEFVKTQLIDKWEGFKKFVTEHVPF